jgi:hypothetical protein
MSNAMTRDASGSIPFVSDEILVRLVMCCPMAETGDTRLDASPPGDAMFGAAADDDEGPDENETELETV